MTIGTIVMNIYQVLKVKFAKPRYYEKSCQYPNEQELNYHAKTKMFEIIHTTTSGYINLVI